MKFDLHPCYYRLLYELYRMQQKVYIQPHSHLLFPTQDIATLVQTCDYYLLTVNFLGLMGVDAPTELTVAKTSSVAWLMAYQQAISHRCYELYYLAWRCTHPVLPATMATNVQPLLKACWFNSAQWQYGLNRLLSGYPYQVCLQRRRWHKVYSAASLHSSARLGINTMLGEAIVQIESMITIVVGPLTLSDLERWLTHQWISTIHQQLFRHHQNDALSIIWQCRQQPSPIGCGNRLGMTKIYLGF